MSNVAGKGYGFTAFTPMKRWKTPFVRLFFWSVPIFSLGIVQRLFSWIHLVKAQKLLLELSFIHFARWSIVKHNFWPHLSDTQPKDETKHDYLMFCSNFNGTWQQYIDAFSAVIPDGMDMIWRWSEQFPGAQPITPFLAYIRRVQLDCEYYYSAYPGATATDVKQSLHLSAELKAFVKQTAHMEPAEFARAWHRFTTNIQNSLGSTGVDPYVVDWQELLFPGAVKPEDMGPRGIQTPVSVGAINETSTKVTADA